MISYLVILAGAATKVYSSLWRLFNFRQENTEQYSSPFIKYILREMKKIRFSPKIPKNQTNMDHVIGTWDLMIKNHKCCYHE